MKKGKIVWLAAAGILLAGGLALFISAFAMVGGDLEKLSTEKIWEEKHYTAAAENIHRIDASEENMRIVLVPSADSDIHITYFENDTETCSIEETADGTLSLQRRSSKKWYQKIGVMLLTGWKQDRRLEIAVPNGHACDIQAESTNGSVEAADLSLGGELTLTTTNGSIAAEMLNLSGSCTLSATNAGITCKNISAEGVLTAATKNGPVDMKTCKSGGTVTVKTENAPVMLADIQAADAVRASTRNGALSIDTLRAKELEADTRNGRLTLSRTATDASTRAETANNKLKINGIEAGSDIYLRNSNGAVTGTIQGDFSDYSITSKTSNADSNLPAHGGNGDKLLEVQTSNGRIDIEFTDPLSES